MNGDYTAPAALAAKALGKPVKLVLTRPDDLRFDSFRSPLCAPIRLAVASAGGCLQMSADKRCRPDGKVAVMEHHASAGWPTAIMAQGFMAKGLHNAWFGPERRRWSEAPSGGRPTCGAEGGLGCRHAEGHGAWHHDHIWTGTRYANLDRLASRAIQQADAEGE